MAFVGVEAVFVDMCVAYESARFGHMEDAAYTRRVRI
jgi:hypothetical protein